MARDVLDRMLHIARDHGSGLAVTDRDGAITYADFAELAGRFAAAFTGFGAHPRVLILTGRERTASEFHGLLAGAGFRPREILATRSPYRLVQAEAAPAS